ncbi:hypothetical protein H4R35_006756 [Dimargaris xerosporica]|nr:hypothetical protein H4R35_006756 [Dimargaris xerosporica]
MAGPPSVGGDQESFTSNDSRLFKATRREVYQSLICITGCLVALGAFIVVVVVTFMYNLSIATAAFSLLGIGIICGVAVSISLKIAAYYTQSPSPANHLASKPTQAKSVGSLLEKGPEALPIGTSVRLPSREMTIPGGDKVSIALPSSNQGPPLEGIGEPPPEQTAAPVASAIPFALPDQSATEIKTLGPRDTIQANASSESWGQSTQSLDHQPPMQLPPRALVTDRGDLPSQDSSSTKAA